MAIIKGPLAITALVAVTTLFAITPCNHQGGPLQSLHSSRVQRSSPWVARSTVFRIFCSFVPYKHRLITSILPILILWPTGYRMRQSLQHVTYRAAHRF